MIKRAEISVSSPFGERKICVCQGDLMDYPDTIHLLTVSAFERNYVPTLGTLIGALRQSKGISVEKLAENPKVDLREFCDCWISRKMPETAANPNIRRIGCIELSPLRHSMEREAVTQEIILQRIQSYYRILYLLSLGYVNVRRIAMPLLGTGNHQMRIDQQVSAGTHRFQDRNAHRDIGDEAPIHHIKMDPISPGICYGADFFTQTAEISGKN